ncbi:MAG: DUF2589 domain-containing protein [Spirochaetaceae bacterium]|jgi:hypothetical protein|nr:DUF2589 domain-containing protein [Spirochaetaceae bacterium]
MSAEGSSRVNLRQLVYSSLEAIVEANAKMSQNMIDTIMKFSDDKGHDSDGYPVVQLKTLQLVYDQMKHDELDMLCTEKIGLEVPLLSIIPLSNMRVSKGKIQFSTDVQEIEAHDDQIDIYTKVAAPEGERSKLCSRIDFEIEFESDPIAEGLSRVIDRLSQNYIPTVHENYPIDSDGKPLVDYEREIFEERKKRSRQVKRLQQILARLNESQRLDEDREEEGDASAFKDIEPYKRDLEERLERAKHDMLMADIKAELDREEDTEVNEKGTDNGKPAGKTTHK